ncbi:hypothetical protein EDD63_11644 [Breznakia blatticola]|uniref:Uncharacterized protein n=1 Tax=Breznakia blatticola TaxID=1754012 RepID=A0A4R7ZQG8_9FIRM|nr:hypothetical protein [Breznakia blatticola]TDW19942.1 hypothetical protein EDD63_11644 [Breznakia blatticola]
MIAIGFTLTLLILVIVEYVTRYDKCLAHCHRLNKDQLAKLNLIKIDEYHDRTTRVYVYQFKDVEFVVHRERFRIQNKDIGIYVHKNARFVCKYQALSKNFKTGFYQAYLQIKYPRTFGKIVIYRSMSTKVSTYLEEFMKQEKLLEI